MSAQFTAFVPRLGLAAACCLCAVGQAGASVYWQAGVQSKVITVCFVGDAVTTRPARIEQIKSYLTDYEYAANIHFNDLGPCPAASTQSNGNDYYDGDVRVVLPGTSVAYTGMVPGKGCRDSDSGGSWSNPPSDLPKKRACLYNLRLNDDGDPTGVPWRNHTLHEFGHALGLAHEHQRTDVDKTVCSAPDYGGGFSSGFLTPYDRGSVMHYQFPTCGIDGNYSQAGLSMLDRLGVHILYPEDGFVAEYVGTTVVESTHPVHLQSAWEVRGANMSYVASGFRWTVDGSLESTSPELYTKLPAGVHTFSLTYQDFLGRIYTCQGTITVLYQGDYDQFVAALHTAVSPLV